jgi:arylsulfatase A-like enzyme
MPTQPEVTVQPHPRFLLGSLLHRITTLVIVVANLSHGICHVFANKLDEKLCRPNVVLILADDLGWGDVAFHGGDAPTPHLDRLAKDGVELTAHYVAPVCSPTRTGLMTGRCWSRFNVTSPQNNRALPWNTVTLPRALKSVGYETCLTGKWHLGSKPDEGPNHFGFDHSYGSLAGGVSPWNHYYKQGPVSQTWHRNEAFVTESGHVTDLIADEAIAWIKGRGDAPFFLYVPFTAVHLPIKEPDEWLKRVPEAIQGDVPRHYAACVMHLDDAVGRIAAAVDAAGKRDDTLIVFTSDNGGSTVENNDLKYPDDNCPNGKLTGNNVPWRGQKGTLYEGGTRVATIANWPKRLRPGRCETPVQIIDWMPTLCRLAGYQPKTDLKWDGRDIWPLLTGDVKTAQPRALYAVAPAHRARSLRYGDWKLIVDQQEATELYDLATDPAESMNLAASRPKRVAELRKLLDEMAARDNDAVAGADH